MADSDDAFSLEPRPVPFEDLPALPPAAAIPVIHAALCWAIELPETRAFLDDCLRTNRASIDLVGRYRPDLWADLRDRTIRRRMEFTRLTGDNPAAA